MAHPVSGHTMLDYTQPAEHIKAVNMGPVPQRIFDDMRKYEDSQRGFLLECFEKSAQKDTGGPGSVIIGHRPEDSQVQELYRMSLDPEKTDLERITYFNLNSGRRISSYVSVAGDDWRGVWRGRGHILAMDLDGNEYFQLWRYWEDVGSAFQLPAIAGELGNEPGGRIERLTHDAFRYSNVIVSDSDKLMAFTSNKENGKDTLVYVSALQNSQTGAAADSKPLHLVSRLVTPPAAKGTDRWVVSDISLDDQFLLITKTQTSFYSPCYLVHVSGLSAPELIVLPDTTEDDSQTMIIAPKFSRDPGTPHLVYMITNAYGDFESIVRYDTISKTMLHITTPEPSLRALRPVSWPCSALKVTSRYVKFRANLDGFSAAFLVPLQGPYKDAVIQVKPEQEGITFSLSLTEADPDTVVVSLGSHHTAASLARFSIQDYIPEKVQTDARGSLFISVPLTPFTQATPGPRPFRTFPCKLMRFKSFDGLEIPCMYYHPTDGKTVVPVVISIHGGPASQTSSDSRSKIHWYIMNELGYAVLCPNVRGSSGYGKRFMAADDVELREDSVKDIGSLLDHIEHRMQSELDSKRIAVMGGSYGGYMTLACLIHYPRRFACGLANFPIAHWPSFLETTAPHRRAHRRGEYGDETDPKIRKFLEKISPINRTSEISVPLQIAHGDNDSRVPVDQAIRMWQTVSQNGVHCELIICEKEGHGFSQKSVIEFTNAAKLHFLERFLPVQQIQCHSAVL